MISKYLVLISTSVIIAIVSIFYLFSPKNLSGLQDGDGYVHAIIAQNIFENGKVTFEMPHRKFEGKKIDGTLRNYPIGYTQVYHLELAIVNNLLGLSMFSKLFTIYINILICLLIYLLFRNVKHAFFFTAITTLLISSFRLLFTNFIEGYVLLIFLCLLYFMKMYLFNGSERRYLYISCFFIGMLMISKHIGLFDGVAAFSFISAYLLYRKRIINFLLSLIIVMVVAVPPLAFQLHNVGTIGYPTGTLSLPSILPFSEVISKVLFSSKYQMLDSWNGDKLSYHEERELNENLNIVSNLFTDMGSKAYTINFFVLYVCLIALFRLITNKRISFAIFISSILIMEFFIFSDQNLRITQYNIILCFIVVFLFIEGLMGLLSQNIRSRSITILIFFTISVIAFVSNNHSKIFRAEGRKTLNKELLFQQIGNQVGTNNLLRDSLFLASDPQFSYWSKSDYIWYRDFYLGEPSNEIKIAKYYFNIDYLVISSDNFRNYGMYDYIEKQKYEELIKSGKISFVGRANLDDDFIEIWRIN